jgi:bacterial/archaeal transporter family-2 protein
MRYLILVLVVLGGAIIPVQVAANKRIEQAVRSPVLAAAIALFVGSIVLGLLSTTGWLGRGRISGAASAPWWVWLAVGAAAVIAATVFGQLSAAAVLDQFGWLGVPQVRLNWWRIGGAVLLLTGTVMMQRK